MGMPLSFFLYGERGIGKTALAELIQFVAKVMIICLIVTTIKKQLQSRLCYWRYPQCRFRCHRSRLWSCGRSLALIADAGHNLSDVLSLLLAWGAGLLATKPATEKRTYGFRKITVMAPLASAILLLVALGRHYLGNHWPNSLNRNRLRG